MKKVESWSGIKSHIQACLFLEMFKLALWHTFYCWTQIKTGFESIKPALVQSKPEMSLPVLQGKYFEP